MAKTNLKEQKARLQFLKTRAQNQNDFRTRKRLAILDAEAKFPEAMKRIKSSSHPKPGRPPIESLPGNENLQKVLLEIAGFSSAVDGRRRTEIQKSARTLDDLVEQLSQQGTLGLTTIVTAFLRLFLVSAKLERTRSRLKRLRAIRLSPPPPLR